jgi:hypothetical protein
MDLYSLSLIHEAERRGGVREPGPTRPRRPRGTWLRAPLRWLGRRRRPVARPVPGVAAVTPVSIRTTTGEVVVVFRDPR